MENWILSIEGSNIFEDAKIELGRATFISGFNATGKSIIARTIYAMLSRDLAELRRLWESDIDSDLSVTLKTPLGAITYKSDGSYESNLEISEKVFVRLIEDYRIALRVILQYLENISRIYNLINFLKDFCVGLEEELKSECSATSIELEKQFDNIILKFLNNIDYIRDDKTSIIDYHFKIIYDQYERILKEASRIISNLSMETLQEEIKTPDLEPMYVTVSGQPDIKDKISEPNIMVIDKRMKETGKRGFSEIPLDIVSSSVAATLALQDYLYVLSRPEKTIIYIIEEPEEALAPPQQLIFGFILSYLADYASQSFGKDVRIIATTHSPYIALGGLTGSEINNTKIKYLYTRFNWKSGKFKVDERTYQPFDFAWRLLTSFKEKIYKRG